MTGHRTDPGSTARPPERAILVGLEVGGVRRWRVEDHLAELSHLARTAGAEVAGTLVQKLSLPQPRLLRGEGKAEELRLLCAREGRRSPSSTTSRAPQVKNLQELTGRRVIDRTELILDIFALRTRSREGRIQVELAQLRYMLPASARAWTHLSRQEGGIGTRGPASSSSRWTGGASGRRSGGSERLADVERERQTQGTRRRRREIPVAALVGYTNAGKSTLMNALTSAGVRVEDRLFATLDPTTRVLPLPGGAKPS